MTQSSIYTFAEALEYLYSFINWEVERHVRYAPEVMTLDRPRRVMEAFGNPHEQYPILHITGTKGKGSVGAMAASALQASGLKAGLYSSPHLQDFRERFRINNMLIPEDEFTLLVNDMKPVLDTIPDITWFEVTTALAFLYFAREKVDAAVIEVGLGGRLDATNIVTPVASVITSISYDHMHLLGNSLASIAREKGGIIKPGVPVVSAPQAQEALDVLAEIAEERHAPFVLVGRDWLFDAGDLSPYCEPFRAGRAGEPLHGYATALPGEHQALNATVALAALDVMKQAGVDVTEAGIQAGLAGVDWPGRLEIVEQKPLLVLDAAHNGESAQRLAAALTGTFSERPIAFVFGASADKDVSGMFEHLLPVADFLIVSQAVHPRALDPNEIKNIALAKGFTHPIEIIPDTRIALDRAAELVGPGGLICTTGSLFIIGEVRSVCGLPAGHVPRANRVPCAPISPEL
ncbi:MAG TPA: folylpolyglutamate synthase/dihydrofolate synthase family protein [Aggregatilinea sp.]|uniref:bifunctional folylpolyglutamate synthase/dihydrofolate synthase n=1 Tax=Aggregatilinea sp. TaxID=2806333 RepID=UPI002C3D962A|nr:folylpolyglutamate synthase/dihydrofolate synthase family protein [Aggregatilinea sp.]HML20059.1 folylpolyglutamate synthase/dihydrofolate synthase family protein [Aggregatilinea sp.]